MENNYELLVGSFVAVIYSSDSFMVSKFITDDGDITVTGPSFNFDKDIKYQLTGNYVEHPKYGFQFNYLKIEKYISTNKEEIISFLASDLFKGIGKVAAIKIYDFFGDDTLKILKNDSKQIFNLKLTNKQYDSIIEGFSNLDDPNNEIIFYLISNGFSNLDAQKIFSKFKLATIEVSKDNPFKYYNDVYGISFEKVKKFANTINFEDSIIKFCESYLIHLISDYSFNSGDIYINLNSLEKIYKLNCNQADFNDVIDRAVRNEYIIIENQNVYLINDYYDEIFIADYLKSLKDDLIIDNKLINLGIDDCENEFSIRYDDKQKIAISNFFLNNFSIINGGPGTGKTTIVKTMVNMFKHLCPYNNLIVVAPTGRAAKRITEICDCEAKTIHSLLKWNLHTNTFAYDQDNPILYDAIIIDEFSMVDNNLFACLLKACTHVKKICIIGDDNQLPSIRPGNLLNDLITSNIFKVTNLVSNYRQSVGNDIIQLSNDIIKHNVNFDEYNNDVYFYDLKKGNVDLLSLINSDINNGFSLDDIQVLAPMYKGFYGIEKLNVELQAFYNPFKDGQNEKKTNTYTFRVNDKILQLKNRPNDDVYNGDIGILEDIDLKEKSLLVNYQGNYVFYNYEDLVELSLAYAMSVHKAQGSEYPIVYFVLSKNNTQLLNINLIYTAISRAKNKLVIISEKSVFEQGINNCLRKRNTSLLLRLKK